MNEPLRKAFSQQEIVNAARSWMARNLCESKTTDPDKYFERLGFLVDFLTDTFPKEEP
jgi:hypothetical protein